MYSSGATTSGNRKVSNALIGHAAAWKSSFQLSITPDNFSRKGCAGLLGQPLSTRPSGWPHDVLLTDFK